MKNSLTKFFKITFCTLLILISPVLFVACGNKDKNSNPSDPPEEPRTVIKDDFSLEEIRTKYTEMFEKLCACQKFKCEATSSYIEDDNTESTYRKAKVIVNGNNAYLEDSRTTGNKTTTGVQWAEVSQDGLVLYANNPFDNGQIKHQKASFPEYTSLEEFFLNESMAVNYIAIPDFTYYEEDDEIKMVQTNKGYEMNFICDYGDGTGSNVVFYLDNDARILKVVDRMIDEDEDISSTITTENVVTYSYSFNDVIPAKPTDVQWEEVQTEH